MMLLGDVSLISIAYVLTNVFLLEYLIISADINVFNGMFFVILILTGLLLKINGMYSIAKKKIGEILLCMIVTNLCALILAMALSFCVQEFIYFRRVVLLTVFIQCIFLVVWRYIIWKIVRHNQDLRTVLLIGTEEECTHVYNRLSKQPQLNMKLKYVCTNMENNAWESAANEVDIIMICPEMRHRHKIRIINYCYDHCKQPLIIPNTFEIFCSGAELDKIDDIPVFRLKSLRPSAETRIVKRTLDILVSVVGFICALPFMVVTAMAIKIGDPGPILYSQIRTGHGGEKFKVYKFRTMRVDAEKYSGPTLAQENDPRITNLGRFLRAVRFDELPQIWNVINGDMSIVGPRPERPFFVEKFTKETPEYAYRHNVKPGITGLAQVYGKYNTTPFDKLVYDLMYIQHCSLLTDLMIIIQTVRVLFTKSATEGTGIGQEKINMDKYGIGKDVYGDF